VLRMLILDRVRLGLLNTITVLRRDAVYVLPMVAVRETITTLIPRNSVLKRALLKVKFELSCIAYYPYRFHCFQREFHCFQRENAHTFIVRN
jgi:hypothetical protein